MVMQLSLLSLCMVLLCRTDSARPFITTAHAADTPQTGCCFDVKNNYCISDATKDNCAPPKVFEAGEANCKKNHPLCQSGPLTFTPNVPLPGFPGGVVDETLFGRYVNAFYVYFAGVAGILAVIMIMYGGFHYITSLGNPQKMNQGKEIISGALIGLILVLTSYLLLNIINPRLTKLVLPNVGYYDAKYSGDIYCEAHDLMNEDHLATEAAKAQKKYCDRVGTDTKVIYEDASGKEKVCYSLAISPTELATQETAKWDEQFACFPQMKVTTVEGKTQQSYVFKLLKVNGTDGVCEDNKYTPDELCDRTQRILNFQKWLKGACKKANVAFTFGITWTGKDVCHYYPFLTCGDPETELYGINLLTDYNKQIPCSQGSTGRRTECWDINKPRYKSDIAGGNEKAYCVDPGTSPAAIEHVDSICCVKAYSIDKKDVVCAAASDMIYLGIKKGEYGNFPSNYVEVQCSLYNTASTDNFSEWNTTLGEPTHNGPSTCNKQCWTSPRLFTTTNQ